MPRVAKKVAPKRLPSKKTYVRGVTQGAGKMPTRVFGGNGRNTKNGRGRKNKSSLVACGLDAFHPHHLSLPRPIAPYTVIKTTSMVTIDVGAGAPGVAIFGPTMLATAQGPDGPQWSNIFCYESVAWNDPIDDPNNTRRQGFAMREPWMDANIAPAAFSVQLMCTSPVSEASGLVRIGRSRMAFNLNLKQENWSTFTENWSQYSAPRLCSAGKLALRGVQVDAVPVNMNVLSDVTPVIINNSNNQLVTMNDGQPNFGGFAPIVCEFTPPASGSTSYRALATCEWRVRFDPANPAYASSVYHPPAGEHVWDGVMRTLSSSLNGVKDIVETVAATGAAVATVGALL